MEKTNERQFEAELHRLRSDMLRMSGNDDKAEVELERALTIARRQQARFWELRAATNLARLWRDHARHAEAHDLLAPVYDWFTEGLGLPDLTDAKALLDQLMRCRP